MHRTTISPRLKSRGVSTWTGQADASPSQLEQSQRGVDAGQIALGGDLLLVKLDGGFNLIPLAGLCGDYLGTDAKIISAFARWG